MHTSACCRTTCGSTLKPLAEKCPKWLAITLLIGSLLALLGGVVAAVFGYLPLAGSITISASGLCLSIFLIALLSMNQKAPFSPREPIEKRVSIEERLAEMRKNYKSPPPIDFIQEFLDTKTLETGLEPISLPDITWRNEKQKEIASKIVHEANRQIQESTESNLKKQRRITITANFFEGFEEMDIKCALSDLNVFKVISFYQWHPARGAFFYA